MRSTKLLAALAGTALLAACAQEELVKVENAPQQMNEVVGTKLIGTDISLNVNNNPQTRWADGQTTNWDESDVLGLGWIVNEYANTSQTNDDGTPKKPTKHELYANHMFNWDESANEFTSKGNFYEGWYFAYYPWSPMYKVASKVIEVSPALLACEGEQNPQTLRTSQALRISNRQFVTSANVKEDNSLDMAFNAYHTMNLINVNTTPAEGSAFVKGASRLADYAIESVKIEVGENVFAKYLRLNAANIPAWTNTAKNDLTVEATNEKNFYDNLYGNSGDPYSTPILSVVNANGVDTVRSTSIETDVKATGYVASDVTKMGVLVTPFYETLDVKNIVVTVALKGGSFFEIKYVEDAESNSFAEKNNTQLEKLVKVFGDLKDGDIACGLFNSVTSTPVGLNLNLYDDIFVTDFNHITNIEEWEDAVKMVDILGRPEETFCIDSTIVFTDTIPMPETCKLTVNRATTGSGNRKLESFVLQDGEFYGWPETLTSNVYLTIAEDATLYDAHEFNNVRAIVNNGKMVVPSRETKKEGLTIGASRDYTLTNNGTIVLGKYAKAQRVDNTDGRIEVIYGSYIELRNEAEAGEIAYVVMPEDAETPSRIKDVVATTGNDFGHASVNILVFDKENVTEFNFTKPINGKENDNPYNDNSSSADEDVLKLDGVSLEINGVAVTSSSTEEIVTVKNVTMTGAEASLTNVNVAGNLTVTDGGDVEVTTIAGDVKTDGDVTADAIAGGLTLSGNGVVSVKSIGGDVNVAGGEINATVAIAGNVTAADATIVARTIEGDVTVNGDNTSIEGNKIKGKVDVTADGEVTLNVKNIEKALTNDGVVVIEGEEDVVIPTINNNATLTANTTINVHNITLKKGVANTTVQEDPEEVIWYTGTYVQGGTTTGKILPKPVTPETETTVTVASPEELATAAIEDGATIALAAGEYVIPSAAKGKNVTFVGTGNPEDVKVAVTKVGTGGENCDYGLDGSTVTFEGITITTNSSTYIGYARCNGTYKNCIINGTYTLYGNSTFEDCTFNVSGDVYNIWTWGAPTAKFVDCTFNSDGKAMLLYGTANTKLTIENCVFNDKGGLTDLKAAVEIGNDYGKSYELIVNNTAVNGYEINDKGINTGTTLWANKNSMSKENLNVVVDGVDVY